MARLLLQGRSSSYSAAAFQVDGLDGEFRAPERYPDHFAFDRISGCSIARRESQGSREWHRADYWSRVHHRFVLGVRLFIFTHGMRTLTDQQWRLPNVGNDVRSLQLNKNPFAYYLYSAPVIRSEITEGKAQIAGSFTEQEARALSAKINDAISSK